jgi:MFS family permease
MYGILSLSSKKLDGRVIASLTAYFIVKVSSSTHIGAIILTALIGIIIAFLILFVIRDYPKGTMLKNIEKKPINVFNAIYTSISNVQIILASFATALIYGAMLAFITFWNIQYQGLYGLDMLTISMLNITALAGIAVGAPLFGWISEKIGKRKPVGIGICICILLPLIVILQPIKLPMPILFASMFFIGFFANNVSIGFSIVKENSQPHLIGTSIAFANTILFLGLSLFQFIPGKISSFLNVHKMFLIKSYVSTGISTMSMSFYVYICAVIASLIIYFFIKETYCKSRIN